jgi:hypothetical protein
MFALTEGILDREPFLIHNLFPRGCLLWAVERARSQKHPGHVVIDEDGWLCTRVSVTHNVVNQAVTATSAFCSPSLGRR